MNSTITQNIATLLGRLLMSIIFIMAGINKIGGYEGTQGYMEAMGVPGMLLPVVILLEIGAGAALLLGWKVRIFAFLLAGFTLLSAVLFHNNFGDQMQMILFMKNLAISGGLLYVVVFGPGLWSLDKE